MAGVYKTPGVYVEEIPKFPPSIAPVETAIPAFIGYTEKALDGNVDLTMTPQRITSLLEYESYFGTSKAVRFEVDVNLDSNTGTFSANIATKPRPSFFLHQAVQAFYANGGGPCYIVSAGQFTDGGVNIDRLLEALDAVKKVDEVTLLISPEAAGLSASQYGRWIAAAIQQCTALQDRFTVLDVSDKYKTNADVTNLFRNQVPSTVGEAKYAAAYYPFIEMAFPYKLRDDSGNVISFVRLFTKDGVPIPANSPFITAAQVEYNAVLTAEAAYEAEQSDFAAAKKAEAIAVKINSVGDSIGTATTDVAVIRNAIYQAVGESNVDNSIKSAADKAALDAAINTWLTTKQSELATAQTALTTAQTALTTAQAKLTAASNTLLTAGDFSYTRLDLVKNANNGLYNLILDKLNNSGVVLPPSSLIAGVYAKVDNSRGVWKAPANESLAAIIGPTLNLSNEYQADLNVDTLAGKSVNAIRSFTGKGTLVWGARTLAGNDNEWRYVSVRRFFNFVEESVKKATEQFVFEPNDANTWVRVQAMIENFLTTLWRQGALQGIKPEHAFYVAVGLGKTMTPVDILEGRMIIEIGMAAVRPAEFIILKFSHKMAES